VVADRVSVSGQAKNSAEVDEPVDLERPGGFVCWGWWWSGDDGAVGQQLPQLRGGEPGRDALDPGLLAQDVHDGRVDPQSNTPRLTPG
jgi:hypothetical protein